MRVLRPIIKLKNIGEITPKNELVVRHAACHSVAKVSTPRPLVLRTQADCHCHIAIVGGRAKKPPPHASRCSKM